MDFFKLLVIFFFSLYNLYLYLSDNLDNYISERFFTFSLIASVLGLALSGAGLIYLISIEKNKQKLLSNLAPIFVMLALLIVGLVFNPIFILLLIPIIYRYKHLINLKFDLGLLILAVVIVGFTIPSRSLTTVTATQRAGDFNSVSLEGRLENVSRFSNTKNYDIGDWIATINYNPDIKFYEGKEVDVRGFVFNSELLGEDYFNVSRFVVTCCAVDARPVGLLVVKENWIDELSLDQWVNVKGKFKVENIDGIEKLVILPNEIIEIEEPERPYIY